MEKYFNKLGFKLTFFFLTMILQFISCGIKDDTGFAVVRELRVAAIIADPPELSPGEEVNLTAYGVDPEERTLTYLWFYLPGNVDLSQGIPEDLQPAGFSQQFSWKAPETIGPFTMIVLVLPVEALQSFPLNLSPVHPMQSIPVTFLMDIPHALAFKNINVSALPEKNRNPLIEDVSIIPSNYFRGETITLTAIASDPDGDELQFAWLSTQKGLSSDYTNPVEFKVPDDGSGARIYLVVRDSRGGNALSSIEILPR